MSAGKQVLANPNEEISTLIGRLHDTGQRLEELTGGEVDTVADRDGRTFMLRRAQDRLRHSEAAKQAAILDVLPAHIVLLDPQGLIVSVNEAWRRFDRTEVVQGPGHGIGVNYLDICEVAQGEGAVEAHQVAAGIRSVLAGATTGFSIEYACPLPSEQRWFLLTVTPLSDAQPNGVVVMHLDVTAQRRSEEKLRASEARFRQMAENIDDVFFLQSFDNTQIFYVSPAYERIWGRTCDSLYANPKDWIDSMHQDDLHHAHTQLGGEHGTGFDYEFRILRPDGEIRWIHVRGFPILDESGNPYRTAGICSDITQRKQAVQELRESERRFSDVLGNVELASVMLDRDARITYCNEYLLRLTGWALEEVLGRDWFDVFMPPMVVGDLRPVFAELLQNAPNAWHRENDLVTRSGEHRLIRWSNSVLRSGNGDVIGTASIGEDITERRRDHETLQQNEERTRLIVESALDAVVVMDADGHITDWNPQAETTFGWTREQAIGVSLTETIIPARHHAAHERGVRRFLETGKGPIVNRRIELSAMHRDGHEFPVELAISPVAMGTTWLFIAFIRDITERKDAENRIRRLNRVHAMLSGINTLIVRVRTRDELFRETCRLAVEAGGFTLAWIGVIDPQTRDGKVVAWHGGDDYSVDRIRFTDRDGTPYSERPASRALLQAEAVICNDLAKDPCGLPVPAALLERGHRSAACFPLRVAGRAEAVLSLLSGEVDVFDDEETRLLLELTGNISFALDDIDKGEQLDYLAYYDVLTGLANRSLFLERVAQYIRGAESGGHKLGLFVIDLERFKNINDSLGQAAGDTLLKLVAEWLTRYTGDASLLTRIDADHFAVVLPEIRQGGNVTGLFEKTMDAFLKHPFHLNDAVFRIAAKAGAALFPDDGADAETLFRNAEAALKKAKASGERCLFYTQKMTEKVADKLTLENQLRRALDQEEFVLHYQPKINLQSGELTGAEALIRWNDPLTGLVPPGQFIPILEETGLIHEVGRWALGKALEDYLRWDNAGLAAVPIAVNVSALQLRHRGFIDEIKQAIGVHPHAAAGLELEITESMIMEDVNQTIATLKAIRAVSVSIAIDDFGTGFSSLSYLAKLPVDTLKIDRSFVTDMTTGPEGLALVSTIINLAHSLKLKVVAEGVETEEQSRLLRLLGCDEMQGYLFSKPVPSDVFETRYLTPSAGG